MRMQPLTWNALEYEHRDRSTDWFWSLGIVALGGAILAILLGNVLFALFIVIGSATLALHALRHPHMVTFQINDKGISIDTTLYPFQTLESYDIHEHHRIPRLIIKSQKVVMPYITIPLEEVNADEVRAALAGKLPEVEIPESLSEKIMEIFGL
jgi:hypothetical protein